MLFLGFKNNGSSNQVALDDPGPLGFFIPRQSMASSNASLGRFEQGSLVTNGHEMMNFTGKKTVVSAQSCLMMFDRGKN